MLFDLSSGRRKRVVQVVYATLALLMGGSLVLFGIGSDAPGGILDGLGIGGGNGSATSSSYDEEIEKAEDQLATDPNNQQALLQLVRYETLSAQEGIVTGEQGVEISDQAITDLEEAGKAWEAYLDTDPKRPNVAAAASASQTVYYYLGDTARAAEAQAIVAESRNTSADYGLLAQYLYFDTRFDEGDAAAEKAVALADPSNRKQVESQLEAIEEQARRYEKQLAKQQKQSGGKEQAEQQLGDPFGALGGGSVPPSAP
jgi:hypothetical protein